MSFKIGDIVRPKEYCIGSNYDWIISDVDILRRKYKLRYLDNPFIEDCPYQKQVELAEWNEDELTYLYHRESNTVNINGKDYNTEKEIKKEMKILDVYKEKKLKQINKEYINKIEEVIEQDEIQNIIKEMKNQIKTILENEGNSKSIEINNRELYTKETTEKIEKLKNERDAKKEEVFETIEVINSLFELTQDYEERIKILINYNILDKKNKLVI